MKYDPSFKDHIEQEDAPAFAKQVVDDLKSRHKAHTNPETYYEDELSRDLADALRDLFYKAPHKIRTLYLIRISDLLVQEGWPEDQANDIEDLTDDGDGPRFEVAKGTENAEVALTIEPLD